MTGLGPRANRTTPRVPLKRVDGGEIGKGAGGLGMSWGNLGGFRQQLPLLYFHTWHPTGPDVGKGHSRKLRACGGGGDRPRTVLHPLLAVSLPQWASQLSCSK